MADRNVDKYNNKDIHFSYDDYKQKVKKGPNVDILIFVSVFVIGLFMILGFVKTMSPGVDVEIASKDENSQYDEEIYQTSIDERLRHLQKEDADGSSDDEMFTSELDEKVVLPKQKRKTVGEMEAEKQEKAMEELKEQRGNDIKKAEVQKKEEEKKESPVLPPSVTNALAPTHNVNAKVVVGYYANNAQAEVAKSIIQDAGIGVTPIVKNMGNYYTLQVGSYTSEEKANQAANNLLKSNFPARVIIE